MLKPVYDFVTTYFLPELIPQITKVDPKPQQDPYA